MRPRLIVRRLRVPRSRTTLRPSTLRTFSNHSHLTNTASRPNVPFLSTPTASAGPIRHFTSERKRWLRHELNMAARYTIALWGVGACAMLIFFAVGEEQAERSYPTPHEWSFRTRKALRDSHKWVDPKTGKVSWGETAQIGAFALKRLEDSTTDGQGVLRLEGYTAENADMAPCDISAKSEEWRRGYYDALLLTAKATEHTEGWLLDTTRGLFVPPEYVIGPSNPRPKPVPKGAPHAPREEDCELAFPSAEEYWLKLSRTVGLSNKQQLDARLEEAAYWEYKGDLDRARDCLSHCLLLASGDASKIEEWVRLDQLTPVRRSGGDAPSANLLDVITSFADVWARSNNLSYALTAYLSILHARRSLPATAPPTPREIIPRVPVYQKVINFFRPPPYPSPPPSGDLPPWRSPDERCQEAALQLHIGEILYATASREEGLAWTRDGVDEAEEQMRKLGAAEEDKKTKQTCRECLSMGLDNWTTMVARLAAEERKRKEEGTAAAGSSWGLGFWKGADKDEGRWAAEEQVLKERVRRTRELVEEAEAPKSNYLVSLVRA